VPAGKTFISQDFLIIIDSVTGGNVGDTSLPTFRLYKHNTLVASTYQITNSQGITGPTTLITTSRYFRFGGATVAASNGKALVLGSDASPQNKIWFRVDSTGTNTYTGLSGRAYAVGYLI
jgi:hypothetical protein